MGQERLVRLVLLHGHRKFEISITNVITVGTRLTVTVRTGTMPANRIDG